MGHHRKLLITSLNNAYFIRVKTVWTIPDALYLPKCLMSSVHVKNGTDKKQLLPILPPEAMTSLQAMT
jgi:hypothetical protein